MKTHKGQLSVVSCQWMVVLALVVVLMPWRAEAQLTASVTPGYTFSPNEVPTTAKLNLLGQPNILISGTVSGTVGLAAKSVNGTHMTDNFVDGTTIDFNGSSPRAIEIKAGGVGATQLATSALGFGLAGGGGTAAFVNTPGLIDTNTITTNASGQFTLAAHQASSVIGQGASGGPTNLTLGTGFATTGGVLNFVQPTFTSSLQSLATGVVANTAHGLGSTPLFVRWVLVCQTAEFGFSIGDELDVAATVTAGGFENAYTWGASASNVWLIQDPAAIHTKNKSTGADVAITLANWKAKCYARL